MSNLLRKKDWIGFAIIMTVTSTVLVILYQNAVENIWFTKEKVEYIRLHADMKLSYLLHPLPTNPILAAMTIFAGLWVLVAACLVVYGSWNRDIHGNPIPKKNG